MKSPESDQPNPENKQEYDIPDLNVLIDGLTALFKVYGDTDKLAICSRLYIQLTEERKTQLLKYTKTYIKELEEQQLDPNAGSWDEEEKKDEKKDDDTTNR